MPLPFTNCPFAMADKFFPICWYSLEFSNFKSIGCFKTLKPETLKPVSLDPRTI